MGLAGSFHFFLTVFFDALNKGEGPSLSRFNVVGEVHWIEAAAGGVKLRFGFFADFGAGQQPTAGRGGNVRLQRNAPLLLPLPCETASASNQPGSSKTWGQQRIGTNFLIQLLPRPVLRPRRPLPALR